MAELSRDRVRAAKLRKQRKAGKLSAANARWLAAYEQRTKAARDQVAAVKSPLTVTTPQLHSPPELELAPAVPAASSLGFVPTHETEHITDVISPDEFTWTPVVPPVPPAPDGVEVEPPVPGVEAPPVGAPILDDVPPEAPQGDPVAAAQYAALVVMVTGVGISSALELSESWPIPPQLRNIVESESLHQGMLKGVGEATQRLVLKWGWKSAPMSDEAVVAGALVGSVAAFVANENRKRKAKGASKRAPEVIHQSSPVDLAGPDRAPDEQPVRAPTAAPAVEDMPPHLSALFGEASS